MPARLALTVLLAASMISPVAAKDKKKPVLPEYVLRAQTALVVTDPDAGEPADQPRANEMARENVEKALSEWGRFQLRMDSQDADLVIVVRTGNGRMLRPTISGGPIDRRPGVAQGGDSTIRIGGQQGQAPPLNDPSMGSPSQQPHVNNEIGPIEDSFAVYRGNVQYPLDAPAVWRYIAKGCLQATPNVRAVEEFRKAIAAAEKPQLQNKKP